MRARHRHYNARFVGATICCDSRYGFSQSDGTAVSTWTSRTGSNNLTQATGSRQPTYEVGEQGGQPTVRFDGTSDLLASTATIGHPCTIIVVAKEDARQLGGIVGSSTRGNAACGDVFVGGSDLNNGKWALWGASNGIWGNNNSTIDQNHNVLTFQFAGATPTTDWSSFKNGVGGLVVNQFAGGTPTVNFTNFRIGSATNSSGGVPEEFWDGDISAVIALSSSASGSVRKRVEHSAAYSFKIACS